MEQVTVSVIVPVYNRAEMVAEAIRSALDACRDVAAELVIVDDASTDGTWDMLQALANERMTVARLPRNGGQSAARNHGLGLARGRYVKFLDSDDLLLPGHLPAEIAALDGGGDIAVSGWIEENAGAGTKTFDAPVFDSIVDDVLAGRAVPTSAALYVRRDDWRWDPTLRKLDDWDYFTQAALGASRIVTIHGSAYVMRHHDGARATHASMLANAREHHSILHKIERRLAAEGRLTPARQRRLAQYYYRELRVLCLHDREAFDAAVAHIFTLDPGFHPREAEPQKFMRALIHMLGLRDAIRLHSAIKRAAGR